MIEPEVSMTKSQLDEKLAEKEQEVYKSILLRFIHCTDGAKYVEDMADDYADMLHKLCDEYVTKFGSDPELEVNV